MLRIRHKVTGQKYTATLGTEFNRYWLSCWADGQTIGPRIALAPDMVEAI